MAELEVDTSKLKPAIEQMMRLADEFKTIMDRLQGSMDNLKVVAGDDPTGNQFINEFHPEARKLIEAGKAYGNGVVTAAENVKTMDRIFKVTALDAQEQAQQLHSEQLHSGPKPKR